VSEDKTRTEQARSKSREVQSSQNEESSIRNELRLGEQVAREEKGDHGRLKLKEMLLKEMRHKEEARSIRNLQDPKEQYHRFMMLLGEPINEPAKMAGSFKVIININILSS